MSYQALLFCPDEKTARVVTQVLTELDFMVEPCNEPFAAVKKLMAQHFDAVVVDSDNEQNATLLFKSARNSSTNHSSLAVAVVEGQAGVAKAFRIGANLVLTKPINIEQSKGTLRVARGLLRKGAEAAKSTTVPAVPVPAAPISHRPSETSSLPKSAFGSMIAKPQPPTEISAPPASQLEVEKEPEPQPEPTEVALLESMPDATGRTPQFTSAETTKDFPWQPVSKPLSEPMASAIRRAAEAAGKKDETEIPVSGKPAQTLSIAASLSKVPPARPLGRESGGGPGAAAAPAPAKETIRAAAPTSEPTHDSTFVTSSTGRPDEQIVSQAMAMGVSEPIATPSFSSLDDEASEGRSGGSKKTLTLVLAVILLLAACAYFGWTKLHMGDALPASGQKPVVPAKVTPPAQTAIAAPSLTTPELAPQQTASTMNTATPSAEAPLSKPSAAVAKTADTTQTSDNKAVPTTKPPEPLIVKTEIPKTATQKPVEEAVAPPDVATVGGSSSSQAISGIVTSTSVNVPQEVPQLLKVSQGVSQGLLIKRVQPVYPLQAMQVRTQGSVQLLAVISRQGSISNVKVLSGEAMLAKAAVEAVRQWRYKPYYLNGEPVEIQTQITVNFKLP